VGGADMGRPMGHHTDPINRRGPLAGRRGPLPDQPRNARIVAMYRAGSTLKKVGMAFGISTSRVLAIIVREERRYGLPKTRNKRGRPKGSFGYLDRNRDIVAMYRAGKTLKETGQAFGVSGQRVLQIIVRDEKQHGHLSVRNSYARQPELRRCASPGCGRFFAASPSDSTKYCSSKCFGRELSRRKRIPLPIDDLIEDRRAGKTLADLVEKYGVSEMTLSRRLRGVRRGPRRKDDKC